MKFTLRASNSAFNCINLVLFTLNASANRLEVEFSFSSKQTLRLSFSFYFKLKVKIKIEFLILNRFDLINKVSILNETINQLKLEYSVLKV